MPRAKNQERAKKAKDLELGTAATTARDQKGRGTGYIIVSLIVAIMLIILGIGYYQNYVAPFKRIIITVDDVKIDMDYFLKRAQLSGLDSFSVLEAITNEQIIKLEAPSYGIEVTPEDIDQELRRIAQGDSETISESEFKEWYRQNLNERGLSKAEYREIVANKLLASRMQEYLAERVPTVADQVHLYAIIVETFDEAQEAKTRWEAGEDFTDLARELSLDTESSDRGGDIGWVPFGLNEWIDYWAFDLEPGEVSEPLQIEEGQGYHLFMVSEKAEARELDEDAYEALRSRALEKWLMEIRRSGVHEVSYNFDSEIHAWIQWQLAKKNQGQEQS